MADVMSILASSHSTAKVSVPSHTKYVPVDAESYEGTWTGKYANGQPLTISVSNVVGFQAKVRYQSGTVAKYQDVLIKDNAFRIGDTKFTLTRAGTAQIKTVMTNPATGAQTLETTSAKQG
jgi:hypothetical protein